MDKDEILAKSRQENKDKDLYMQEIESRSGNIGVIAATALATLFFIVQLAVGRGVNTGFYAILFSVGAAQFTYKAIHIKSRRNIALAALYIAVTLLLAILHIYTLAVG